MRRGLYGLLVRKVLPVLFFIVSKLTSDHQLRHAHFVRDLLKQEYILRVRLSVFGLWKIHEIEKYYGKIGLCLVTAKILQATD